uniref:MADF domain-containing protein n=1 Tax=Anopheles minimus TaxID=112268 RepID=A0A182WEQ2_9DIPT
MNLIACWRPGLFCVDSAIFTPSRMNACGVVEPTEELVSRTAKDQSEKPKCFNPKETLQLIECVRQKPKLWDRQFIPKRRSSCISEWEEIQQKEFPDYTVNQLKVRWKTIRDTFRRESRRIECGDSKSRWPLYEKVMFLDGHYRLQKRVQCNVPSSAKQRAKPSRPKQSVLVSPCEEVANGLASKIETMSQDNVLEHEEPASCLPTVGVKDATSANGEVTCSNKIQSPLNSSAVSENNHDIYGQQITDSQFLMSLVPFFNHLPMDKNLQIRLKILQVIANAYENGSS